jgi:HEAT repeat protein
LKAQVGIFTTDIHLVIRTWDAWLERVTLRAAADVCGRPLTEAFREIQTRGLISPFLRALEQGAIEFVSSALHGYLIACPPQTHTTKFQQMQQRAVIAPIREELKITGLVVTIEDVTDRRASEIEGGDALASQDWRTRRQAVEEVLAEPAATPVAELISKLRQGHRDPSLLNSVLHLLTSGAWDTFDSLIELTDDDEAEIRMQAALALGNLKDRRAIATLSKMLKDADLNVRYHAIEALGKLKASETVNALAEIAESDDFFLAFPALEAIATIGEPTVATRFVPLLHNEILRTGAIGALSKLGDHTVVEPLAFMMDQPRLVSTVVEALTTLHQRYERQFGEGEYIAELTAQHISKAGTENLLKALSIATGEPLRMVVRVLGWVGAESEAVIGGLTSLLGSPTLRSEVIETLVRCGQQVTVPLCRQLESEELETRRAAITALGRIGDPACVPSLIGILRDPELTVDAAAALARIGDRRAYEPLLELLVHDRPAVRQAAVGALNSLGHPRMPHDVRRFLMEANPYMRESAVRIAGYFGYPECADLLLNCLKDPNENVRRSVIESLPNLQDKRVLPILRLAICDESPRIRTAAAQSLGHLEDAAAVPELVRAIKDSHVWVRYYASRALGQIRSPESIDALADVLRDDEATQVRVAAADALGSIGGRRAVSILAPFVNSEDRDLGRAALLALGAVGHPDALDPILSILRSNDSFRKLDAVRAVATRADRDAAEILQWTAAADTNEAVGQAAVAELARMATPESIAGLLRLTSDRRLRETAIEAISGLGPKHIERIKGGLSSPQLETRRAVVEALGRMKHPEASEALRVALDDDRPEVRLAALIVLRRLGNLVSDRKVWSMAHNDPDPGVREAAAQALQR